MPSAHWIKLVQLLGATVAGLGSVIWFAVRPNAALFGAPSRTTAT